MKRKAWLIALIIVVLLSLWLIPNFLREKKTVDHQTASATFSPPNPQFQTNISLKPFASLYESLHQQAPTLKNEVIEKVISTLQCAKEHHITHGATLTVIDFSMPSNQKRLWVFDLNRHRLLFHTYVSHGIKSGTLLSSFFSNKYNSKASSIGIFKTDKPYVGRHGESLQLTGLEQGFNDNASGRAIVLHGGWYVEESFIKKYGRAGRSWGCPAVPSDLTKPIINTIKDQSLFVAYYPSDSWIAKSRFLHCQAFVSSQTMNELKPLFEENQPRDDVLFASVSHTKREDGEAVLAMRADDYQQYINAKVPVERMLRRQIENMEYIALSNAEFQQLLQGKTNTTMLESNEPLSKLCFVIPVIKMQHGYAGTEMKILKLGKIKEARAHTSATNNLAKAFTVYFDSSSPITLRATNYFVRWLGL